MAVGFRIYNNFVRAPKEDINMFDGLPVANIADCMNRIFCIDQAIRPLNDVPLLGTAFTVKVASGDNLMLHKAIEMAQEGDVILVNGFGCMERSLCGGLMMEAARQKGIRGFVIDGCVRDHDDIIKYDNFSCYARGVQPNGPYKNGPGEINVPIAIGGQVVMPGDIIVGDQDGLVVISPKDAKVVAEAARKVLETEEKKMKDYSQGKVNREWLYKSLESKNCEFID